jgi:putative transposase
LDYALRWKKIKAAFSRRLPKTEDRSASRINKGERGIWQRRYWEHTIRDEKDYQAHFDYIHFNPVKHGYVSAAREWPHSSFPQSVTRGVYPVDWGGNGDADGDFGE